MPLEHWLRSPDPAHDAGGSVEGGPVEALTALGARALGSALSRPGRDRAAAFDLLAADALVTYACEAALETPDAEASLERILRRVSQP
jgi:hypothetical protein